MAGAASGLSLLVSDSSPVEQLVSRFQTDETACTISGCYSMIRITRLIFLSASSARNCTTHDGWHGIGSMPAGGNSHLQDMLVGRSLRVRVSRDVAELPVLFNPRSAQGDPNGMVLNPCLPLPST